MASAWPSAVEDLLLLLALGVEDGGLLLALGLW